MRTELEVKLLKQIWALMIHHGRLTDPTADWNYYGGDFNDGHQGSYRQKVAEYKMFVDAVKEIGVQWINVDVPEYHHYAAFVDSYTPSESVDVWTGWLHLNDGTKYYVSAKDIDVKPLVDQFQAIQGNADAVDLVTELFG